MKFIQGNLLYSLPNIYGKKKTKYTNRSDQVNRHASCINKSNNPNKSHTSE